MIGPEKRHRMDMRYKELTEMYPNLSHFKKDRIIYEEFLNIDKKDYKSTFKTDLCIIIFAYSVIALVYLL